MPANKSSTTPPAPDAAGQTKDNAKQSPEDLVRVYNRSRRQFTDKVEDGDEAGRKPGRFISPPNAFCTIPRWLADKWIAGYPDDFLPGDSALKTLDSGAAELIAATEKIKALEDEKAALQLDLEETKKQLAEALGGR